MGYFLHKELWTRNQIIWIFLILSTKKYFMTLKNGIIIYKRMMNQVNLKAAFGGEAYPWKKRLGLPHVSSIYLGTYLSEKSLHLHHTVVMRCCVNLIGLRVPKQLVRQYFWLCLWGYFPMSVWNHRLSKEDHFYQWGWYHPIHEEPEKNKKVEEGTSIFSCPWTLTLLVLGPSGTYTSGLGLNYTTGIPSSPVCRWQIMGVLGLHNGISQFL